MTRRKTLIHLEISEQIAVDLRSRQSVRTTFKLSERSIEALSILSAQLGIKQKSLFDHLVEDTRALQLIAEEFEEFSARSRRVAKTYVVSRKSLENLERVSLKYDTPRDALVEYSIERILPLIEKEKEKHRKRIALSGELHGYLLNGLSILKNAEEELGEDDPAFRELLPMMRAVKNCSEKISRYVQKGEKLEDF
jgi:hypothetical protein